MDKQCLMSNEVTWTHDSAVTYQTTVGADGVMAACRLSSYLQQSTSLIDYISPDELLPLNFFTRTNGTRWSVGFVLDSPGISSVQFHMKNVYSSENFVHFQAKNMRISKIDTTKHSLNVIEKHVFKCLRAIYLPLSSCTHTAQMNHNTFSLCTQAKSIHVSMLLVPSRLHFKFKGKPTPAVLKLNFTHRTTYSCWSVLANVRLRRTSAILAMTSRSRAACALRTAASRRRHRHRGRSLRSRPSHTW